MRVIPKLQTGFVPLHYQHVAVTPQVSGAQAPSTSQDSKNDDELLSDTMQKLIIEHSLPSDAMQFLNNASIFGSSILSGSSKNSPAKAKELLMYLTKMHHEKDMFIKNKERLKEIKGESEIAISNNGGVFVLRDNQVKLISVSKLRDNESPLTNEQIMNIRANSTKYAFNTDMTSAISNATSMHQIRNAVDDALQGLGIDSTTEDQAFSGRNTSKQSQIIEGINAMNITMSDLAQLDIDQLIIRQVKSESNANQIQHAVQAIYQQLDRNQQILLQVKAKQLNELVGSDKITPMHIILEYANARSKGTSSVTFDFKTAPGATRNANKESKEEQQITPLIGYATGEGQRTVVELSPGNTVKLKATGTTWGAPMGDDSKVIGPSSLQYFLNKGFGPMVDASNGVYMGDQKIQSSDYNNVYFDGQQLSRVYLPVTQDEQGTIHPNMKIYKRYEEISNKATNAQDRIKLLKNDPELAMYVDDNGNWRSDMLRPFFAINAYADGESNWFGGHSGVIDPDLVGEGFIYKAEDLGENVDALKQSMYKILGTKDAPYSPQGDIYKGVIFLPIRTDATVSAMQASGQNPTITASPVTNMNETSIHDIRRINQQLRDGQQAINFTKPSSSKLFIN